MEENIYTKVIGLKGHYFIKDYQKTKKNIVKTRENLGRNGQKSVSKRKLLGCNIFEETEKELILTINSPKEEILKYLGKNFYCKKINLCRMVHYKNQNKRFSFLPDYINILYMTKPSDF